MTKLLISVECGEKTCLPCYGLSDTSEGWCDYFRKGQNAGTPLKSDQLGVGEWLRCPACLAAERKAKEKP